MHSILPIFSHVYPIHVTDLVPYDSDVCNNLEVSRFKMDEVTMDDKLQEICEITDAESQWSEYQQI